MFTTRYLHKNGILLQENLKSFILSLLIPPLNFELKSVNIQQQIQQLFSTICYYNTIIVSKNQYTFSYFVYFLLIKIYILEQSPISLIPN